MKSKVFLSLGSNMGDRIAFINTALARLADLGSITASQPYENPADGFNTPNTFMNVGAILTVDRTAPWTLADAEALLDKLQSIEHEISAVPHRHTDGSYRDREIDIDIIAIEGFSARTARLTLPHPRAGARDFVLTPLRSLYPAITTLLKTPSDFNP